MHEKSTQLKDGKGKTLIFLLVFFLFSVINGVLGIFCLGEIRKPFILKYFLLFSGIYVGLILLIYGLCVWFVLTKKNHGLKISLSLCFFLSVTLLFVYVLQKSGFFQVFQNSKLLQEYLEQSGAWMPVLYTLLQFLQVVVLPVPGVVSTAVGVTLFGAFWTMIYSFIGIVLGSFAAFWIGRKLGYRAVAWMVGEDNLSKWQKKLRGKDNLFLTIMFLLPLFPDDILCFFAGLSSMSSRYFAIMICITRAIAIAATCYSVDFIPFNTWWGITIWIVFVALVVAAFIVIYKNLDKMQAWIKKIKRKRKNKE